MTTETSPGRAACEAFWAAVGAGPDTQEPAAAWDWAFSQNTTRAWEAAAKAAADARLAAADDELRKLRGACQTMGRVIIGMARSMEAARIEMLQNGPEAAMQWILNSIPDVDDNDPGDQWNGTETATEWLDRTEAGARELVEP